MFGQAFGGRVTVKAHVDCNNRVGRGAEGQLARATSLTNFLRSVHGLATLAVPALAEDGRRFNVDLASGELTPSTPTVKVRESDSALHLYAEGSEGQLRGVIRNWRRGFGSEIPTFDDLPPSSRGKTTGDPLQARAKWVRSLAFGAMPSGSRANP